jgi:hypothetical protein
MELNTVLQQVFEDFIKRMETSGTVDPAVVKRVKTLLENKTLRPDQLRGALFPNEDIP